MNEQDKPTVFFIHHSTQMGGAEHSLLLLANGLGERNWRVVILLPDRGPLYAELSESIEKELLPILRLKRRKSWVSSLRYFSAWIRSGLKIRRLTRRHQAALIHANCTTAFLYAFPKYFRKRLPLVWHVRDFIPPSLPTGRLISNASRIICTSTCMADQAALRNAPQMRRIPNPIPIPDDLPPRNSAWLEGLDLPADAFLVAQVGQLIPGKRVECLIGVAELLAPKHPNAHFLIVGEDLFGDFPDYRRKLEEQIAGAGLADRFRFVPWQEDMTDCYAAIDVLFHPALEEPFGRVLAEAMAFEKPVVAVAKAGPAEIVVDGETGFLAVQGEVAEMAGVLGRLLADGELRRVMGVAGRRRAEEMYGLERHLERMEGLYGEILKGKVQAD